MKRKQRRAACCGAGSGCGCARVRAGRVRVRVLARGHVIARGSRTLRAERAATVVARLNAARPPDGRGRPFRARVRVRLPGRAARPRAQDPRALSAAVPWTRVPEPLTHRPDVLVLAAGGTLGEAWMRGLLDGAGAATGIDFRDCEYFVGTSAGSIVAAFLAAGREPDSGAEARAARDWGEAAGDAATAPAAVDGRATGDAEGGPLAALGRLGRTAAAPFAPLALAAGAPGGAVARAAALAAVPRTKRSMPGLGRLVDESGAALRRAAADRRGRPPQRQARDVRRARRAAASVAQAVLASCSIPWVFAPVEDRRARVRRRRRLEPDEPRRHPGAARHRGAVPQPDGAPAAAQRASRTPPRWPSRSR